MVEKIQRTHIVFRRKMQFCNSDYSIGQINTTFFRCSSEKKEISHTPCRKDIFIWTMNHFLITFKQQHAKKTEHWSRILIKNSKVLFSNNFLFLWQFGILQCFFSISMPIVNVTAIVMCLVFMKHSIFNSLNFKMNFFPSH